MQCFDDWLAELIERAQLPPDFGTVAEQICRPLVLRIQEARRGPGFLVGLCGAQGSGKSTISTVLGEMLHRAGLSVAVLSLDDLYLTAAERQGLASNVHPLLATRGVPGTHDLGLGVRVIAALSKPGSVALPRFDKAVDDRLTQSSWPVVQAPVDVILLEGWCVGARAQAAQDLIHPVNELERLEDPELIWRTYVNQALAGPYRGLFDQLDLLVLLAAPSFDVVLAWRQEQEAKLRARVADAGQVMSDEAVVRFVAHYERITRWILQDMPDRADIVIRLNDQRRPI